MDYLSCTGYNKISMEKIIIGIILIGIGSLFFTNNKNIAKGTAVFYQKLYTEKNLTVMFKLGGAVLIGGGFLLMFTK